MSFSWLDENLFIIKLTVKERWCFYFILIYCNDLSISTINYGFLWAIMHGSYSEHNFWSYELPNLILFDIVYSSSSISQPKSKVTLWIDDRASSWVRVQWTYHYSWIKEYYHKKILGVIKRNPLFFHSISCKNNGFLFTPNIY